VTVVAAEALAKRFGGTHALRGVDLRVASGEVVGLIGANGAGKSTLIAILSGATRPSSGTVTIDGVPVSFHDPLDARRAGVATVYQNVADAIVAGLSVAENLTLGGETRDRSDYWVSASRTRRAAAEIAAAAHLDVDLGARVEDLSASERQHLVIARALAGRSRLLILDEPTAALSPAEANELTATVRRLADGGVAVLYVSHRLAEIEAICDRVAVLRDGAIRRVFDAPFEGRRLVEAMLGTGLATVLATARQPAQAGGEVVLAASGVRAWAGARAFGFEVRRGEVVGVTGLVGAGKTELLEQVYGARALVSGSLALGGRAFRPRDPAAAVAAGVGFVPEERSAQAVVPGWSLRSHVTLPSLREVTVGGGGALGGLAGLAGLLSRRREQAAAERVMSAFGVRSDGAGAAIETLSGGNQQKVIVGRWLGDGRSARLVLLDEPFRGVDVGARAEIGRLLRSLATDVGVIVASSDPLEVLAVADRVLVLHAGTLAGEVQASEATAERLAALMAGTQEDGR
jgi:simple sugar transport system ATP-binding protein